MGCKELTLTRRYTCTLVHGSYFCKLFLMGPKELRVPLYRHTNTYCSVHDMDMPDDPAVHGTYKSSFTRVSDMCGAV